MATHEAEDARTQPHRSKTPIETSARAMQILHAADELLTERGPDQVSLRDIAERARVNKALIFYYFGSRTELFEKVLERYYKNHAAMLSDAFRAGGSLADRIDRTLSAYADFMDSNHLFARLVVTELTRQDETKLPLIRSSQEHLFTLVQGAFRDVLPNDGPLAARHFYMTLAGAVTHYYLFAGAVRSIWNRDPMDNDARNERREHLRWIGRAIADRFEKDRAKR